MRTPVVMVSVFAVALIGCATHKVVEPSNNVTRLVTGRCIELKTPVFVLFRTDQSRKFVSVPPRTLAMPSTTLTPFPIASFQERRPIYTPYGRVERILQQGARLRISRILIKYGFENRTLAVVAVTENGTDVEISYLCDAVALVRLLDGIEGAGPVPNLADLLDQRVAEWCVAER